MKTQINIGFDAKIWEKCELVPQSRPGRFDLVTLMDSALVIFETEFLALLEKTWKEGYDHIIVTGALPTEINVRTGMILERVKSKFKRIEFYNPTRNPTRRITLLYESTST